MGVRWFPIPSAGPARRTLPGAGRLAGCLVFAAVAISALPAAAWQGGAAQKQGGKGGEEDPFADELNPLGSGRPRTPAAPVTPRADTPSPRPVPEVPTLPGDPAAGRPLTPDGAAPERPRRDRSLPLPFPEAQDDFGAPKRTQSPAEPFLLEAEKFERDKKYREAAAVLEKAVAADPKNTLSYLALGMNRRRLGDLRGAVKAYSDGLKVDEFDAALLFRRGIAWFRIGEYRIALEDFDDAAGLSFDDPLPEFWKGLTLMELDRPRDAIVAYSAAIQRDRTVMNAYLNRGLAYLVVGEPDKAETDFELAIRRDPGDVRAWFNRGVAQARQREYANAAASFRKAVALDPSFTAARQNLDAVQARGARGG